MRFCKIIGHIDEFKLINTVGLLAFSMFSLTTHAANLEVKVVDANGAALTDAVVYALPENVPVKPNSAVVAQIEQIGRKFSPLVTVLQTGSEVSFPNHDTVRHHIYSFSATKKFEMKLYSGVPSENILFDKPGTVVLGCNIHDKMIAYLHIVNTPYFAKTDAHGMAIISKLPKGKYQLKVWHFQLPAKAQIPEHAITMENENFQMNVKLTTHAAVKAESKPNSKPNSDAVEFIY